MIKNFLKKLFAEDGEVSSKRVVGFGTFLLVVEIVQTTLFKFKTFPEYMFWGLLTLIAACFGLNTLIDVMNKKKEDDDNTSTT